MEKHPKHTVSGLSYGHQEVTIPPVQPEVSTSPYHTPRGRGEQRFFEPADIAEELHGESLVSQRERLIRESAQRTLEEARLTTESGTAWPVLQGVQRAVTEVRIQRAEKKIIKLEESKLVTEHVLERVDGNQGYKQYTDPMRTRGFRQKIRNSRIERNTELAQKLGAKNAHVQKTYGQDVSTGSYMDRMNRRPLSLTEKIRHIKFNASAVASSGLHRAALSYRDRIATKPERKQQKHIARRQKLGANIEAIEDTD